MILSLISWYLVDVPKNILEGWKNFLKFGLHFFSIPFLFKTLFLPWRKYYWLYPRGFDLGKYIEVFLSNLISRFLGMMLRLFLILVGIVFEIIIFIFGIFLIFSWYLFPLFLIFIFVYAIELLLQV